MGFKLVPPCLCRKHAEAGHTFRRPHGSRRGSRRWSEGGAGGGGGSLPFAHSGIGSGGRDTLEQGHKLKSKAKLERSLW
jgi:hypothetical protein